MQFIHSHYHITCYCVKYQYLLIHATVDEHLGNFHSVYTSVHFHCQDIGILMVHIRSNKDPFETKFLVLKPNILFLLSKCYLKVRTW